MCEEQRADDAPRRRNVYHVYNPSVSSGFTHDTSRIHASSFEEAGRTMIERGWYAEDGDVLLLIENGRYARFFRYAAPQPARIVALDIAVD